MDIDRVLQALGPQLLPDALRAGAQGACAFELAQGPRLEWRYQVEVDSLFVLVPVGRVLVSRRADARRQLLEANLMLADMGAPHFAADPQGDNVYLCCCVAGWCHCDTRSAQDQLRGFLQAWAPLREAFASQGLIV